MSNEVVVQKDKAGRSFFDLPADAVKHLKLKIGDWVELSIGGKDLYLCKVDMCTLKTSLPPAAVDSIRRFKEEEGYGSEEEAVANLLIRGLVLYLKKSKLGEDMNLAAKLGNKWYLQIHEAILHCGSCGKKLAEKDVKINTPKYGLLCAGCWAKKMGKHVEKHPISD